ncbi:hypothetical protein M0Q50_02515 [bacterium]|jgi:hypothetical protein|nr:hypothetical protein [bacterium]
MKYYYKTTEKNYLIQECPYFCSDILSSISESMGAKIGSYSCTKYCNNIIDYNDKEKYVICETIIKQERLKKLKSL